MCDASAGHCTRLDLPQFMQAYVPSRLINVNFVVPGLHSRFAALHGGVRCAINTRNITLQQFQEHYAPGSASTGLLDTVQKKLKHFIDNLTVAEQAQLPKLFDGFDDGGFGLGVAATSW